MKKVLIIEDDLETQGVYKKVLASENFDVTVADNGHDGLEAAKSNRPDLILLDIMLPGGLNGFDILEQLKRIDNLANVPVLVLTNLDSEEQTAKSIGAADYIVKTKVSLDEIVKKVKDLCQSSPEDGQSPS